jgi:murein DD-endopeptidase MepM/ murein hydrolase activator NlpD
MRYGFRAFLLPAGVLAAAVAAPRTSGIEASQDTLSVSLSPERVPQGSIFEVSATPGTTAVAAVEGSFAGEPLHFDAAGDGTLVALAAAPVDAEGVLSMELEIRYAAGGVETRSLDVPVVAGGYPMEQLTVAPEFGAPQPPEIQRRIDDENARAMAVSRNSHRTPRMWELPFVAPRESVVTSGFGNGRMFNGQVESRHMGTDFRGQVGAPVIAPARGRVALVDAFYLGGNVIYIDHGAGLVTAYLHLSEQDVAEGDMVEPGQVIGRVGATGRVTGPHLHWIVRYGVVTVDGRSLLALRAPGSP